MNAVSGGRQKGFGFPPLKRKRFCSQLARESQRKKNFEAHFSSTVTFQEGQKTDLW